MGCLEIPAISQGFEGMVGDGTLRWELARRLLVDEGLRNDDRVAGLLVLLYGETLSAICRLRIDSLTREPDGSFVLRVDRHRLPIHRQIAELIETLPYRGSGIGAQLPTEWLFPQRSAASHTDASLMGGRLRALGIEPRIMRNTARADLATQLPTGVLSEVLGISPATAVAWSDRSASNWTQYAASRTDPIERASAPLAPTFI